MIGVAVESDTTIAPTADAIREWICCRIARALRTHPSQVDPDIEFDRYGLDSVEVVHVTSEPF